MNQHCIGATTEHWNEMLGYGKTSAIDIKQTGQQAGLLRREKNQYGVDVQYGPYPYPQIPQLFKRKPNTERKELLKTVR